jgi:phosphoribosylformimino-5-aminoimidazole carboxamide ribotide isomerase
VTCGTIAVYDPDLFMDWLSVFGAENIILGADFFNRQISTYGWCRNSSFDVVEFIKDYFKKGVKYTICTDIKKDGMLNGPSYNIYREIHAATGINLIASGGIVSNSDLYKLSEVGCEGAIIGKAVYEGIINMKEISGLC